MRYEHIKKILFHLEPESAHHVAAILFQGIGLVEPLLQKLESSYLVKDPMLQQELFGVTFCNPVGLAAGFDKNATMVKTLHALGFCYIEVGTVTPKPQAGNPKPRLFRYVEQESLQNAMGFNNDGADVVAKRLQKLSRSFPLGINIGKNKTTPQESAIEDYALLIDRFKDLGDYLVVNISSPNTPNLRDLQNESFIKELFELATKKSDKPILLKIAPDMSIDTALDLVQSAIDAGAAGIIATNTSTDYSLLAGAKDFGGISGKVLKKKSFALFKEIAKAFFGKTVLISVGGIDGAEEAYKRIRHGASLLQIYSAFIYQGPSLLRSINQGLIQRLKSDGFEHISQAIGVDL